MIQTPCHVSGVALTKEKRCLPVGRGGGGEGVRWGGVGGLALRVSVWENGCDDRGRGCIDARGGGFVDYSPAIRS